MNLGKDPGVQKSKPIRVTKDNSFHKQHAVRLWSSGTLYTQKLIEVTLLSTVGEQNLYIEFIYR